MDIFSKRPLFISLMLFSALSVAGYFMSGELKLIIIIIAAAALVFSAILALLRYHSAKKKYTFLTLILCLIMTVLSLLSSYSFFDKKGESLSDICGKENYIQGVVTAVDYQNNFSSGYTVSVELLNGESTDHTAALSCEYPTSLNIGDRISAKVTASEPESSGGRYDEKMSYLSEGIFIIYTSEDESSLQTVGTADETDPSLFFIRLNAKLSSILTNTVKGDEGDLSSALLLGNKDLLSDRITRDFRRVGASHILALSGMHMSLIMGALSLLLARFIPRSAPRAVVLSVFALFYLALTGFSVSVSRSVIMLLIVYLSLIISAEADSLTSLSVAAFIILLVSPGSVLDAGFWMSFASTLGIIVYIPPMNEFLKERVSKRGNKLKRALHKGMNSFISAIATSVAALMPLIIVMCIFIKEISVLSILSSLVLSVPTAVMIILSLLLLPFYQVPYISEAITYVIRIAARLMIDFCAYFSQYEDIVISLNYPFAAVMAIALGATLLISLASEKRDPFVTLIPFAVCILVCLGTMFVYERTNEDKLKVAYINASSSSDMIVLSNEREAVICDISNGSMTSYQYALDEINESRATEIGAVMLTRYTHKHSSTLYKLFQSSMVRELWVPYPADEDEYYKMRRLREYADEMGVEMYVYRDGEVLQALEHAYIEHTNEYIDRSSVPIDLISVYTGAERITYASPGFNESKLADKAEFAFSRSQYVIIGGRGPKPKTLFELGDANELKRTQTVTFANETVAAYFSEPEYSFITYYLVPKSGKMEYYLNE